MNFLDICKQTTPEEYYSQYGFTAIEEAEKNLSIERTQCFIGKTDRRKLKSYDKIYPLWKSFFFKVLPNHINDSYYMTPEQVQNLLKKHSI